ncbi:MAG: Gfo/Idh/MocA family protein [Halobacteriaceae archaeon]
MTHRMIQVGTGSRGETWCKGLLKRGVEDGLIDVVAAVDVNPDVLENATHHLGVPEERLFTDVEEAFSTVDAEFCSAVVPPWSHEEIVDAAVAHDLHVLSEKPIADTLPSAVRIAEKVERAGLKHGVTMSHRFDRDKLTLERLVESGDPGPMDYVVSRFTCDRRYRGNWGSGFRHDMDDPLLIEGSVHHLSYLVGLCDSVPERLYARTWQPPWAEYGGDTQALLQLTMADGTEVVYEGAKANAVGLNDWSDTYVRAECRDATLILDHQDLERHDHDPDPRSIVKAREGEGDPVPLVEDEKVGDHLLLEQFVTWLAGGEPMPTNVWDDLQSVAILEAARQSSQTGEAVDVQGLLGETRRAVRAAM